MTQTTESAQETETRAPTASDTTDPSKVDRWGTFTSALCAIHCMVFAFLPGVVSALGLGVLFVPALEWALALLPLLIASVALFLGWRRHRSPAVVAAFVLGGSGLIMSRLLEEMGVEGWSLGLAVCAAGTLILGHILNSRFARQQVSG